MPVCDFYTDYNFIVSLIFVDVLFHVFTSSSPRLSFSYLAKDVFCLHTTCQIAKKGRHTKLKKAHEIDNRSKDNSDFKVMAASLIQKKKSGPTSTK